MLQVSRTDREGKDKKERRRWTDGKRGRNTGVAEGIERKRERFFDWSRPYGDTWGENVGGEKNDTK